ncbi:MAG: glycosyltransferase family 2 protein [Anaerolineae bacterium]|nr:glycosyltransferase family 2 protein [Anaerolineae bacterium]
MKLSIVIPARNEAGNIADTLHGLLSYLDSQGISDLEILVVDDGSQDETYAIVVEMGREDQRVRIIRNTSGKHGYGRAVALGLDSFTGDAVVVCMADASDAPEDVARYYAILRDEAECAFGSRFVRGSKVIDYPLFKLIINRLANFVIRMLFGLRFNDVTNAFKGYRANVIEGCRPFVSPHFNLTIEIPLKAIVRGYSYKITPISWRNRRVGVSQLKLQEQGSRYLYTLLTVWFEWLLIRGEHRRSSEDVFAPLPDHTPQEMINQTK